MRIDEVENLNKDDDSMIFGHKLPDWSVDEDIVAVFSSRTGFNVAQVFKSSNGLYVADLGKGNIQRYRYHAQLENALRKNRITIYEGEEYYRPSY